MALELSCSYRAVADPVSSVERLAEGRYELVGRALPIDGCAWEDGWVIEVDGLAVYVTEQNDRVAREAGSDPIMPVPGAGGWVRVRGALSIAEYYVTSAFEPEDALLEQAERPWTVQRIVQVNMVGQSESVAGIDAGELVRRPRATGYLVDITL
jgi:hypothetical protein